MKIAVLSDIHGNLEAFNSVLAHLESVNIQHIVCLGDVVGYGPRPNECIELVQQHCAFCLMGNHDFVASHPVSISDFNELAQEAVLWTRRQLTPEHQYSLQKLPFIVNEENTTFVHSTIKNPQQWDYIFSYDEALENFTAMSGRLAFIGHSHIPIIFSQNQGAISPQKMTLSLETDRFIINVGSVGQPRDGNPKACVVIYDEEIQTIDYLRISYPIQTTYQQILEAGLPAMLAKRLLLGR